MSDDRQPAPTGESRDHIARRILDAAPVIIGVVDLDARRVLSYNLATSRALPGSEAALERGDLDPLRPHLHPRDLEALTAHLARIRAAQDGEAIAFEVRLVDPERTFGVRCMPFTRGDDGHVREILVSAEDITTQRREEMILRQSDSLFLAFREHMPPLMFAKDGEGTYLLANPSMDEFLGLPPGAMLGRKDAEFFPPEVAAKFAEIDDMVRASPTPIEADEPTPNRQGGITHFYSIKFPVKGPGIPPGTIAGISIDLTRAKVAEAEREAAVAKEALILAQQETIKMLATPLMPIAEGVVVMPLIGSIDEDRASRIMETLLDGITTNRASIAIIDITGVKSVDLQVAEALLKAARAVRLLGAKVVLTGISPQIATTLVALGVDWQGVVTEGTLRDGIAHALRTRTADKPAR